jgi:hypothetical protein
VDSPSNSSSTLFTTGLSVDDSSVAFDALPSSIFSSVTADVTTTFMSLAFDPWSSNITTVSSVTRLSFSADNETVSVSDLSDAITFTLDAVNTTDSDTDAEQGACLFYNETTEAYESDGCVTMPSMYPSGHTLAWGTTTGLTSDADLAGAWSISGDLVSGCTDTVIDCSTSTGRATAVRLNGDTSNDGYGTCGSRTTGGVRVFSGASCALWRSDNSAGCNWNASAQAFTGGSCVSSSVTQCACRHATDYTSAITTLSTSDLESFDASEIITKIAVLFAVVISMFGGMHLLAFGSWFMELFTRRRLMAQLQSKRCGWAQVHGADQRPVHVWHFTLTPLLADIDAVRGTFVEFCAAVGLPLARLRCCIPEELLASDVPTHHGVGRKAGLDPEVTAANSKALSAFMTPQLRKRGVPMEQPATDFDGQDAAEAGSVTLAAVDDGEVVDTGASVDDMTATVDGAAESDVKELTLTHEHMISTALATALAQVHSLLPARELEQRRADAAALFEARGVSYGSGRWTFEPLVDLFLVLFSKFNIGEKKDWMDRACLWRIMLLSSPEGCWHATDGLALALNASNAPPPPATATAAAPGTKPAPKLAVKLFPQCYPPEADADAVPFDKCPLKFDVGAIEASMPECLASVRDASPQLALRAWTTSVVAARMRVIQFAWLVHGDGGKKDDGEQQHTTLVDVAEAWLAAQPELVACAPELASAADAQVVRWLAAQQTRITHMRAAELRLPGRAAQASLRHAGDMFLLLMTSHQTFSIFTSPFMGRVRRWQMTAIVVSCGLALLVVDIWFEYSNAYACCALARESIGCSTNIYDDCVYSGTVYSGTECTDLSDTYDCDAFPDRGYGDTLLAALICIACALPVKKVLGYCFQTSNEVVPSRQWLTWTPFRAPALGRTRWRFASERPGYIQMTAASNRGVFHLFFSMYMMDGVQGFCWLCA